MQFGSSPLFEGINITFNQGNKYGLIGANGSGKSTFMKILSGEQESTSGNIKIDDSPPQMDFHRLHQKNERKRRLRLLIQKN